MGLTLELLETSVNHSGGGELSVKVIDEGNGIEKLSSNPGPNSLHFILGKCPRKNYKLSYSTPTTIAIGKA